MTKPGFAGSADARAMFGLAAAALLAFALRAAGFPFVITRDAVLFAPGDAMYHVRRAFVTFSDFPRPLLWDAYINHPDGAPVPWPPLTDWLYAAVARLVATDLRGFEVVMAWAPVLVGTATVMPVYLLARRVGSRASAVGAAFLYAAIPIAVQYARVGNPDHHVAVAHVGAWLLLACVAAIEAARDGRPLGRPVLALALARLVLLFTWHGSLLYFALSEATLLVAAAWLRRPALAGAQALSLLVTIAVFAPVLATFPTPLLGPWSSIAPSRLHTLALSTAAVAAAASWAVAKRRSVLHPMLPFAAGLGCGLLFAGLAMLLPGPRAGIATAFGFLGMTDAMGARTAEQFPLFSLGGRAASRRAGEVWGHLAFALPVVPLLALALARRAASSSAAALVLAAWTAFFGWLALAQIRYGNDAAPAVAVVLAAGLAEAVARIHRRHAIPRVVLAAGAVLLVSACLATPIRRSYAPQASRAFAALRSERPLEPRTASAALHRFLRDVREVTPETAGFVARGEMPEYGVVAHANLGHAVQWVARRPTPTDPFWSYIGPENWRRAFGLLRASDESQALQLARELRARYVITTAGAAPGTLEARLHAADASQLGEAPAFEHFRLVAEGRRGARPLHAIFARNARGIPDDPVPYKCFEIVEGAQIEIDLPSAEPVQLRAALRSPGGRAFVYRRQLVPERAGVLSLRVPYAAAGKRAWEIVQGPHRWRVEVTEEAVHAGARVRVEP